MSTLNPTSRKPRVSGAPATPETQQEGPASFLRITAKIAGFRRCGIAHAETPTDYPEGSFTPEEIARLEAEPMLVVQRLASPEIEAEASADTAKKEAE